MSDPDWQALQSTWQNQAIDLPRLQRRTLWKTWRMRVFAGMDLLAVPLLWGLSGYLYAEQKLDGLWLLWALFWCALAPWCSWWSWRLRRGTWATADQTVLGLVALQKRRAEAASRIAGWSLKGFFIGGLITIFWTVLLYYFEAPVSPATALVPAWLRGPLFTLIWLWAWAIAAHFYGQKKIREIAQLQTMLAQLSASDNARSDA